MDDDLRRAIDKVIVTLTPEQAQAELTEILARDEEKMAPEELASHYLAIGRLTQARLTPEELERRRADIIQAVRQFGQEVSGG